MSFLSELVRFIPGCLFFPVSFVYLRQQIRSRFKNKPAKFKNDEEIEAVATSVAMRLVSTSNAVFMIVTGLITVMTTGEDITNDRSPVIVPYCYMGIPYMFYDVYAMFKTYTLEKSRTSTCRNQPSLFKSFYLENTMITTHHLMVGVLFYPLVLYYLNGKGDFIMGIFFLSECSTPFLSFRHIMKKTKLNMPTLFLVNDIFILIVFFCCRVVMIPYSYWLYGRNIGVDFLHVPFVVPLKCNVMNLVIFAMQFVWFLMILKAAGRVISKYINNLQSLNSNGKTPVDEVNSNHMQKVD